MGIQNLILYVISGLTVMPDKCMSVLSSPKQPHTSHILEPGLTIDGTSSTVACVTYL